MSEPVRPVASGQKAFPPGMKLGAATSATQIEGACLDGGRPLHDWMAFALEPGRVEAGDSPEVACDHWNRWAADVELIAKLGLQAYRMGIEWARIEPRPGELDGAVLDRYRAELAALVDAGVEPMVTLHHFTLPTWLRGGLLDPELPARLIRFTEEVARALGDLCSWWITINEPNVVCAQGFLEGLWPPARQGDMRSFIRAQRLLLEAHVGMYGVLHDEGARRPGNVRVGVAHHLRVVEPERKKARDRLAALAMDIAFNEAFASAVCSGRMTFLDGSVRALGGFDPRRAKGTQDFFGLNYYSRDLVSMRWSARKAGFVHRALPPGAPTSDLGWEIYPEGLYRLVREWHGRSGVPVVVTENGIADASDDKRAVFLVDHLDALCRAADEGAEVAGYFHWSLMDNFEWAEGYAPRFGLYEVDFKTQERRLRPSGELYRNLIAAGGLG